jgi:DNA repair exonuclease SbcCD ATPase subunit
MKKIDKLVLTNFKKHENYIGKFHGNHFVVFGLNGAGKTTVIDAIKRTFGQKAKVLEPIKQGADGATIQNYVMKDNEVYCLEEKISKTTGKGRLKFYRVNGNLKDELKPTLERFYDIFGNPIDFTELIDMNGDEQFDFLKDNLGFDLSVYEHNYRAVYEDRTLIGREVETLKGVINDPSASITDSDIETYKEPKDAAIILQGKVDLEPLLNERGAAEMRAQAIRQIQLKEEAVERRIKELQAELVNLIETKESFKGWYEANPPIDTSDIDKKIEEAKLVNIEVDQQLGAVSQHNEMYYRVRKHLSSKEDLLKKQALYNEKTKTLEDIEEDMKKTLTQLPIGSLVPGLEIVYINTTETDDKGKERKVVKKGLMLEGLPFNRNQHSYGKLLKAVIKMAAHFNADKLNFIPIRDWNLLDPLSQQELLDFAKDNPDLNIQFGIERVDSNTELQTEIIEFK